MSSHGKRVTNVTINRHSQKQTGETRARKPLVCLRNMCHKTPLILHGGFTSRPLNFSPTCILAHHNVIITYWWKAAKAIRVNSRNLSSFVRVVNARHYLSGFKTAQLCKASRESNRKPHSRKSGRKKGWCSFNGAITTTLFRVQRVTRLFWACCYTNKTKLVAKNDRSEHPASSLRENLSILWIQQKLQGRKLISH